MWNVNLLMSSYLWTIVNIYIWQYEIKVQFLLNCESSKYIAKLFSLSIYIASLNNEHSKACLKQPPKNDTKIGFQYQLSLNAGQKYCRMLPL